MPPERSPYDVIIVGARAAGAATAMLLARQGLHVLVVDRSRYGADTLSTHGLMRAGVLQLHRWGLIDQIVAAGTPPIRRTTFNYGRGDQVAITIKPSYGVDALYAPRRTVLDPILVDAAASAGAEIRYGVTVTDVCHDDRGHVTGIVGRDEHGRTITIGGAIVVGADGVRSTIAERVAAGIERAGTGATAVAYGYWSDLDTDGYEWIFTPNNVAGIIPTNHGQACVFAGGPPARVGAGGIGALRQILTTAAPEVAARIEAATAPTGVRNFRGRPGFVRRSWGPGWALVGDAGCWKDPISVHGLTDAFRDAELLARAITGSEPGGPDRMEALAEYQETRDRLSTQLFGVADTIAAHQWTAEEIPGLLMQLSSAMADEVEALAALDSGGRAMSGTLLGIWAHPDDEAYLSAGLMAEARRRGDRVVLLTATAGEHGTADPDRWPPRRLARRRRAELRASLAILDVHEHQVLDYPDGGCSAHDGTGHIVDLIEAIRPDTIVTFGPEGMTGHPDHRAVSQWATDAWQATGGDARLWYATLTPAFHAGWGALNEQVGLWAEIDRPPCVDEVDLARSIRLDGARLDQKVSALRAHASQTTPLIDLAGARTYRDWWRTESFVDVETHRRLFDGVLIGATS